MFDGDVAELDADAALTVAAQLRASADRAEARLLEVAAHFADLHPVPAGQRAGVVILPGMENVFVCGGEGCPEVAEFAPAELGAALGVSTGAATALLEDALALRHRLPRTWRRVVAGEVPAWRARRIARATCRLGRAAAGLVDARVWSIAQALTPYRLERIVEAAVMDADPAAAQAEADAAAAQRGVWVAQSDLHGTKTMVVKAAAGDVIRLEARTQQIADTLAALGDTDTLDRRRAKAIGWLADPQAALDLIAGTNTPTTPNAVGQHGTGQHGTERHGTERHGTGQHGTGGQRKVQSARELATRVGAPHAVYVHLTDRALLAGTGLVRADRCGPLLVGQLSELLGHDRIVVKPVIDLRDRIAVDAYEIPPRIREHVLLRHTHCIFPWCNRPAGPGTDLDHIVPYDDTGPPGQTATDTVAPQCRLHHRIKTFGAWRCRRTPDGAYEWTSPHGRRYRVDHTGTHPLPTSTNQTDQTAANEDDAA